MTTPRGSAARPGPSRSATWQTPSPRAAHPAPPPHIQSRCLTETATAIKKTRTAQSSNSNSTPSSLALRSSDISSRPFLSEAREPRRWPPPRCRSTRSSTSFAPRSPNSTRSGESPTLHSERDIASRSLRVSFLLISGWGFSAQREREVRLPQPRRLLQEVHQGLRRHSRPTHTPPTA